MRLIQAPNVMYVPDEACLATFALLKSKHLVNAVLLVRSVELHTHGQVVGHSGRTFRTQAKEYKTPKVR
jgi:hypothetical protein